MTLKCLDWASFKLKDHVYGLGEFVMRKLTSLIIVLLISLFLCSCMGEEVSKHTSQSSVTDEIINIINPQNIVVTWCLEIDYYKIFQKTHAMLQNYDDRAFEM